MSKTSSSRRRFLKATAASASTLALAGAPFVHAQGTARLKIGLVGCGGRGTGAGDNALRADPNTVLWAMGDAFPDRLQSSLNTLRRGNGLAQRIDVPAARQFVGLNAYQGVIDSGADVVLLCTPPGFRPMQLWAAVNANKHVFCEKPVAVDAPGCRMVAAACEKARRKNLSVVSGLCYRYDPPKRELIRRIQDGAIGQIVALHTTYNTGAVGTPRARTQGMSDMEWQMRNWWFFTWLSGDHNVEQHIHSLDKMAWAMGDQPPAKAVGLGGRQVRALTEPGHIYDHHAVVYEYANNVKCFAFCRQWARCQNEVSDFVIGTTGTAQFNAAQARNAHKIVNLKGAETWRFQGQAGDMYQHEHEALFRGIRNGQPLNNGDYMVKSTLMAIMGRMVTYTGRELTWQQVMNSRQDLSPPSYEFGPLPPPPTVARPGMTTFS